MSLSAHGSSTLAVEVSHVSSQGIWLLSHDKELFLSYDDFPWFIDQPLKAVMNVEEPSRGHFYWPDIDVDVTLEMIENPENFPLQSKNSQSH